MKIILLSPKKCIDNLKILYSLTKTKRCFGLNFDIWGSKQSKIKGNQLSSRKCFVDFINILFLIPLSSDENTTYIQKGW